MQAERELDALIAEKVMGWTLAVSIIQNGKVVDRPLGSVPRYSSSIIAAISVFEKIREKLGPIAELNISGPWDGLSGWKCRITAGKSFHDFTVVATAHGASAPHAICLAALKAVGG